MELRHLHFRVPISSCQGEGNIVAAANGKVVDGRGGVKEPVHAWTFQARRVSGVMGGRSHWFPHRSEYHCNAERSVNLSEGTADMNAKGKSDEPIVSTTSANNDSAGLSAESSEKSGSTKRNDVQAALSRTQGRIKYKSRGLHGVREAARKDSTLKFTALLHHVSEDCLTEAFYNLKKSAAVGVDGVTWYDYEQDLEANIADLHDRIHRGAYRAKPCRRSWIPKPDGRQRPLGIAALEDKIVQQAVLWVLQSIYEQDFLGFSYGFRPGRSQHQALDALSVAITGKKVNWILDADVKGFFDAIDHQWLIKFLEHRIGDRRVLRLIRKWLRAGVIEEGEWSKTEQGSPQGSVISPLLSNVYLHYVFDLWIEWWRKKYCRQDVIVVRYADDFVIGFESEAEASACLEELRTRFAKFGLKLHEDKTRLIEFGRYANERRQRRGAGRPETFDFLGFTHKCGKTRKHGWFTIHRHSVAKRMRATLQAIKVKLRKRMHRPLGETARWLRRVVQGWLNYHAVPGNSNRIGRFVDEVTRLWLRVIRRRSQRGRSRWTWKRMHHLVRTHLPRPRILHPYPDQRFRARLKVGAV
jgi:group II intron reverse transcriptase/maturase